MNTSKVACILTSKVFQKREITDLETVLAKLEQIFQKKKYKNLVIKNKRVMDLVHFIEHTDHKKPPKVSASDRAASVPILLNYRQFSNSTEYEHEGTENQVKTILKQIHN